jgi:hypothetical protein
VNKAFVKEAEDETSPKCPACLAIGQAVGAATLQRHLIEGGAANLAASSANFCPNPTCDVAYFDANRQTVGIEKLRSTTWPKRDDPDAVLCACLGVTARQIVQDATRDDPARVRAILDQARSNPHQCCEVMPYAAPCAAEAQRLYLKSRTTRART